MFPTHIRLFAPGAHADVLYAVLYANAKVCVHYALFVVTNALISRYARLSRLEQLPIAPRKMLELGHIMCTFTRARTW